MNPEQASKEILGAVGGEENIISLVHCATRLRFKLKDHAKANKDASKKIDGVITVIESGGQYQVVIGNRVGEIFNAIQ